MARTRRVPTGLFVAVAALLVVPSLAGAAPAGLSASYPIPPGGLDLDRALLSNLSAPSVDPGSSTAIAFRLYDPPSFGPLSDVVLTLELYALNGYPGDAVGPVPVANAPVLANASASGPEVNVSLPSLGLGETYQGSVSVVTSAATPAGTYAVRCALSFVEDHSAFLFESRGWFSLSAWEYATEGANGSATINASRLNVSGIVPETAVYVAPSGWPVVIDALLGIGVVVVGLGAWLVYRKGPGSRSGTANGPAPEATNAPRAFGSSRNRPGDSRSS